MPETITIGEIKNLIKEEKIQPSALFGREQLADDPVVKGYVEEERKIASSGEYAHRKRTDEAFDKARQDWEKEKGEYEQKIKNFGIETAKTKAVSLIDKKVKERKLEPLQVKFINENREYFTPEDPEKLEKEVDDFLDFQIEDFKKQAKIFGHGEQKEGDVDKEKNEGTPPDDTGGGGESADHIPD